MLKFRVYATDSNGIREYIDSYDVFSHAMIMAKNLSECGYATELFHENDLRIKFPPHYNKYPNR